MEEPPGSTYFLCDLEGLILTHQKARTYNLERIAESGESRLVD